MQVCRLPLPEGWKSGSHSCRRRSAAPPGNFQPSATCLVYVAFHRSASVQIANNSGYIQVDWKRVEKDVNKAKKQLKKETDRAAPELNTIFEKVTFLFFLSPHQVQENRMVRQWCDALTGGGGWVLPHENLENKSHLYSFSSHLGHFFSGFESNREQGFNTKILLCRCCFPKVKHLDQQPCF